MAASVHAGPSRMASGSVGSGWDEQIVPALRKRLESESAYLSNRMSGASFSEIPTALVQPAAQLEDRVPRTRTKSSMPPGSSKLPHKAVDRSPGMTPPSPSSTPASRIPMRPRSKSNLAPRPSESDLAIPPADVPPLPSLIPRSRSGRGSPDLMPVMSVDEGFLKNELPPFKLRSDEAMRIAQRGHDLNSDEDDKAAVEASKRKRRETMRVTEADRRSSKVRSSTGASTSKSSMSRSATGDVNLGLGLPSSRLASVQSPRASSSRQPKPSRLSGPVSASAPRSASLNMLAAQQPGASPSSSSSARLGVAAHFVPPESTYTPPKGQNWDEVVLPTVAKKLGLNESTSTSTSGPDAGDLAVEWDKSGTPIKWIKKESVNRVGGASEASRLLKGNSGLTKDDFITREPSPSPSPSPMITPNRSAHSAFSPTFEPSPDNPLASPSHLNVGTGIKHRPSQNSLGTPIRTSSGQYTPLARPSPPPSPAPFSQTQPKPDPARGPRLVASKSSLGRKESTSRQPSSGMGQRGASSDRYFTNPRPVPIAQSGTVFNGQRPPAADTGANGARQDMHETSGKKKDEHGKGCGCIIM